MRFFLLCAGVCWVCVCVSVVVVGWSFEVVCGCVLVVVGGGGLHCGGNTHRHVVATNKGGQTSELSETGLGGNICGNGRQ